MAEKLNDFKINENNQDYTEQDILFDLQKEIAEAEE